MLSGVSGFVHRHRKKLLVTTGLVAGGYFLVDYVKSKFFELQDRLATERAAKENLKRRFEQNQQDATFTIMALLPSLSGQVMDKYPVEKITQELQAKRGEKRAVPASVADTEATAASDLPSETSINSSSVSAEHQPQHDTATVAVQGEPLQQPPKKTKTQLWKELKIESLTRAFTLIYTNALLVFFTRLQLNILGRKNYVVSVIRLAEKRASNQISMEDLDAGSGGDSDMAFEEEELQINRMYLTFSWWLLNKGWVSLSERIQDAVVSMFDSINPRTDLSLAEFSDLIGKVQYRIDHEDSSSENNFLNNLLPPSELESYVLAQAPVTDSNGVPVTLSSVESGPLRKLLDETADFIESPNAVDVVHKLVHSGLSVFVSKVSSLYPTCGEEVTIPGRVKLASILANVTRQTTTMTGGTPFDPNEYIRAMIDVPELDGFSALVYSNFDWSNLGLE
jgi:peroxin-3